MWATFLGSFKEKIPKTIHSLRPCHREPQHLRGRESEETGDAWELMIKTEIGLNPKITSPQLDVQNSRSQMCQPLGPVLAFVGWIAALKEPRTLLDDLNLNTKIII